MGSLSRRLQALEVNPMDVACISAIIRSVLTLGTYGMVPGRTTCGLHVMTMECRTVRSSKSLWRMLTWIWAFLFGPFTGINGVYKHREHCNVPKHSLWYLLHTTPPRSTPPATTPCLHLQTKPAAAGDTAQPMQLNKLATCEVRPHQGHPEDGASSIDTYNTYK